MAITDLPTAAEIRVASRLRPEQVSVYLADTTALEADIDARITEQEGYVEMRLEQAATPQPWPFVTDFLSAVYPDYSSVQVTAVITRHNSMAALAVKYFTLGDLYDSAGQLNERYQAEADNYMKRGEKVLDQLVSDFTWIVSQGTSTGDVPNAGVQMLSITVGEDFSTECL